MGLMEFIQRLGGLRQPAAPSRNRLRAVVGYGVELTPCLPCCAEQTQGILSFGPLNREDPRVGSGGVVVVPGDAPTSALELRSGPEGFPGDPFLVYSSGEPAATELQLMPGMASAAPFLAGFKVGASGEGWTVVTDEYAVAWPDGFALRALSGTDTHSAQFVLSGAAGDLFFQLEPSAANAQESDAQRTAEPGKMAGRRGELVTRTGPVTWEDCSADQEGVPFVTRTWWLPLAEGQFALVRAQASAVTHAGLFEVAESVVQSFRPCR